MRGDAEIGACRRVLREECGVKRAGLLLGLPCFRFSFSDIAIGRWFRFQSTISTLHENASIQNASHVSTRTMGQWPRREARRFHFLAQQHVLGNPSHTEPHTEQQEHLGPRKPPAKRYRTQHHHVTRVQRSRLDRELVCVCALPPLPCGCLCALETVRARWVARGCDVAV